MRYVTRSIFKAIAAMFIVLFAAGSLSACSTEKVDMSTYSAVIDVRTPGEVTESGALEGALLYDWQGPDFSSQISTLDPAANYFIYCRSGNRAGQAIEWLQQNGFTGELTKGGGLQDASAATGLPIVNG
jgi:phage shock protein E